MHTHHAKADICTDFEGEQTLKFTSRVTVGCIFEKRSAQSLLHVHNSPKCTVQLVGVQVPPAVAAR